MFSRNPIVPESQKAESYFTFHLMMSWLSFSPPGQPSPPPPSSPSPPSPPPSSSSSPPAGVHQKLSDKGFALPPAYIYIMTKHSSSVQVLKTKTKIPLLESFVSLVPRVLLHQYPALASSSSILLPFWTKYKLRYLDNSQKHLCLYISTICGPGDRDEQGQYQR